ncbi:MAG: putative addiction module antidote protein [Kiritimatiellae bacterium]|nr:putative addiction module antidote protein [Kiritimatiellia bacterium]
MSKTKTTRYDIVEHLRTPEEIAAYLEASFEESKGDASFVAKALGDIAQAKGMTQVPAYSRESLHKALSGEHTPGFDTILKVVQVLGIELHAAPYAHLNREANKTSLKDFFFLSHQYKNPRTPFLFFYLWKILLFNR